MRPSENTKILEINEYNKSAKALFVIYTDLESLIEKMGGWKTCPEKSFIMKVGGHILSGFLMSTENKHDVYRDKVYIKSFVNP